MSPHINAVIVFPRLYIQNFNVASAPFTWGAPAPSAAIGFMHALQRTLSSDIALRFRSIGYVVHELTPQTHDGYVQTFNLTRNPVGSDGKTQSIVEEGRAHMEASIVLGVEIQNEDWRQNKHPEVEALVERLTDTLVSMRFAGGTIWPSSPAPRRRTQDTPYYRLIMPDSEENEEAMRRLRRRLLPGYALVSRHGWLGEQQEKRKEQGLSHNLIDAWMDSGRVTYRCVSEDVENKNVKWVSSRQKGDGWLVPIPAGFVGLGALNEPGIVKNSRDETLPFHFVETAYSVGEWVGIHRLQQWQELLWYPETNEEQGTYLCKNDYETLSGL